MWKLNISLALVAAAAISLSRKFRLSSKYERNDKNQHEVSDWKSLDRGIDPTIREDR